MDALYITTPPLPQCLPNKPISSSGYHIYVSYYLISRIGSRYWSNVSGRGIGGGDGGWRLEGSFPIKLGYYIHIFIYSYY